MSIHIQSRDAVPVLSVFVYMLEGVYNVRGLVCVRVQCPENCISSRYIRPTCCAAALFLSTGISL